MIHAVVAGRRCTCSVAVLPLEDQRIEGSSSLLPGICCPPDCCRSGGRLRFLAPSKCLGRCDSQAREARAHRQREVASECERGTPSPPQREGKAREEGKTMLFSPAKRE